jgi:hypothetical protein
VTGRRIKAILLVGGLAASGVVFLAWTQQWFAIELVDGKTLVIAGDVAAGALSTLALTCIVLVGALSIAGPVFRVVLGGLEALLGLTVVLSGVLALVDPAKASAATISDSTGISGSGPIHELVAGISITAWPWVSIIAGVLVVILGIAVIVTSRQWPGSSRKYSAVKLEPVSERTAVDDWDSLSDGTDPTSR